jgi:hypothetical protein
MASGVRYGTTPVEACRDEPGGERLAFKVEGSEGEGFRKRNARGLQAFSLPRLGGRVIDFKDTEPVLRWVAIRVGVQAGAQDHQLRGSLVHRRGEGILRQTRPGGDEQAHTAAQRIFLSATQDGFLVLAEDAHGERVGEDFSLFQKLVRGAMSRGGEGGSAWLSRLHSSSLSSSRGGLTLLPGIRIIRNGGTEAYMRFQGGRCGRSRFQHHIGGVAQMVRATDS